MFEDISRTIGVISDTHGLLRPWALELLKGSDIIIHAGDIGNPEILETLKGIAPLFAVRGNVDQGEWADSLPKVQVIEVGEALLCVLHDLQNLDVDPVGAGFRAVIYGHSHRPSIEEKRGVLFLNPGSAGQRRFRYPVAMARLQVHGHEAQAEIIELRK